MASPSPKLALDANALIDLARGVDDAADFFAVLWRHRIALTVTSTALGEIRETSKDPEDADVRAACVRALRSLGAWGVKGYDLSAAQWKQAEDFSYELRAAKELPQDQRNDGRLPAEAAMAGCGFLATEDKHLLAIEAETWKRHFRRAGLPFVHVISPRAFLRLLR